LKVLVTGATGFVGVSLVDRLERDGVKCVRTVRRRSAVIGQGKYLDPIVIGNLNQDTDWSIALDGVHTVVHLAARVHVMRETATDSLAEFRLVNVQGTVNLARQAAEAGVRRFVFVSSVKVNGERSLPECPLSADQIPAPVDSYGVSKCEAEDGLRALSKSTGMEVVIIRPPLVYGPGVKANFLAMMLWLWRGVPLPLGGVTKNKRSLVFLDNLVDLLVICIDHPAAANQTFMVSDDEDLSTTELLRRMAAALGCPARLIPVPAGLIMLAAKLVGRPGIAQRLCGSLQVDIGKTKSLLGWVPPVSVDEGLRQTAVHLIESQRVLRG